MFRKFVCIFAAAVIALTFQICAQAAEGTSLPDPAAATSNELPDTGDYPAPILTAMMISFGVVILLVMTENRKK